MSADTQRAIPGLSQATTLTPPAADRSARDRCCLTRVLIEDTVVLIEYSPGREQIMMGES